jgi:hypothetical protein
MKDDISHAGAGRQGSSAAQTSRDRQRADALRQNLLRRKAQARAQALSHRVAPESPEDGPNHNGGD